jgi:aspartate racemase
MAIAAQQTIGLLGGMSWVSTEPYYRIINETVNAERGGLSSARILLLSVDFEEIEALQRTGAWDAAGERLAECARQLEHGGADFIVLCTNTMHRVAEHIERATRLPLLHIADATAQQIAAAGHDRVGLLGTRYTMEEPFYRQRLERGFGLEVLVPDAQDRSIVNDVIFDELCRGEIRASSRDAFTDIAARLIDRGAQSIVLGCTEVGLLLTPGSVSVPLFDTCRIHAEAAARQALLPGSAAR